jgi:hypothetical protein
VVRLIAAAVQEALALQNKQERMMAQVSRGTREQHSSVLQAAQGREMGVGLQPAFQAVC